jgi:hypothetical protein
LPLNLYGFGTLYPFWCCSTLNHTNNSILPSDTGVSPAGEQFTRNKTGHKK